ncbi:YhcG family protein [Scytonema sp. NUACC26]|uniref:PDDEXK nuclease domain-containing protein n=1 Tax=Scytonema sp. NUACC26 TaxID=3140176 RepID=UPI0034DB7E0A
MTDSLFPENLSNYDAFLSTLKQRIRTAQVRAALAVNQELVLLYWQIGREILQRQQEEGWGTKVIERIAKDLKREFPDIKGFSRTNLLYMRAFAEAYPDEQFVQQAAGQIPWFHNCVLLDRVKAPEQRVWYIQQTIQNGWSRAILEMQIESRLYERQGSAVTNFSQTLPRPQSDLAQQLIKDPYHFDFLTLGKEAQERDLERALVERIRDFLLELGAGFSFVGSQYPIEVSGQEYRLDLLFYHLKLRCFVIIDLKMVEFQPEFSGKMNFYVSAVNSILRHPDDRPTIGIILCKSKNKTIAELALQGMTQPIGVSTHKIGQDVPEQLKNILPTVEQLEMELDTAAAELEKQKQGRMET